MAWHQDLSIPVRERVASPECSGWSQKQGVIFVQPPLAVLEQLIAVRVHLDECGNEQGPLRVVPGSHRFGRLDTAQSERLRRERGEVACPMSQGGGLVLKPLLLHASSKSTLESSRRVLRYVFGPPQLPHGLTWYMTA